MPKKITFIGAGSVTFTRNLVRDILTFPAFRDCEIALMDIDADNLSLAKQVVDRIVEAGGYPATVSATLCSLHNAATAATCPVVAPSVFRTARLSPWTTRFTAS